MFEMSTRKEMIEQKNDSTIGRRARECTHFWNFKQINPKLDIPKDKRWKLFEV